MPVGTTIRGMEGGKKEKRIRDESIRFRVKREEGTELREAAGRAGLSLSGWMRDRLLTAARREAAAAKKAHGR